MKKRAKDQNKYFSKDIQMAKNMKRWSAPLVIRELQIKTMILLHTQ